MAGRGRNQPQPPALQRGDLALVQILQMMQNRDANRDNSRKQFLMFRKSALQEKTRRKQKTIGLNFLNTLTIKTNKEPSQET